MADPHEFEAFYRSALKMLGGAQERDLQQMPLDLMTRMYGPLSMQHLRATTVWLTALLASRSFPALQVDVELREYANELAAGIEHPLDPLERLHATGYGRLLYDELDDKALKKYYRNLNNAEAWMRSPLTRPAIKIVDEARLVHDLFELSVSIEILYQQRGSLEFPAETVRKNWVSYMETGQLAHHAAVLEKVVVPNIKRLSSFAAYRPAFQAQYFDVMDYVRDHIESAVKGSARVLPGDLRLTVDTLQVV